MMIPPRIINILTNVGLMKGNASMMMFVYSRKTKKGAREKKISFYYCLLSTQRRHNA